MDTNHFRGNLASAFSAAPPATQIPRPPSRTPRPPPRLYSVPSRTSRPVPESQASKSFTRESNAYSNVTTPNPTMRPKRTAGEPVKDHNHISLGASSPYRFDQHGQPIPTSVHTPNALLVDIEDREEDIYPVDPPRRDPTVSRSRTFATPMNLNRSPSMPPHMFSAHPAKKVKPDSSPCFNCTHLSSQVQDLKTDIKSYETNQERYKTALRTERHARQAENQARRVAENENERLKDALADLKDALELNRSRMARVKQACVEEEEASVLEEEQEKRRMAEVVPSSDNEESLSLD